MVAEIGEYEVARLTDLSDTERPGKYWYKRGCGYLQHPKYMDGVGNLAGYEATPNETRKRGQIR